MSSRFSIHGRGLVGHVEEISVAKEHQGKGLGLKMIQALDGVGKNVGCYKNILNCGAQNEPFYVRSEGPPPPNRSSSFIHSRFPLLPLHPCCGRILKNRWAHDRLSVDTSTRAQRCRITLNRPRTTSIEDDYAFPFRDCYVSVPSCFAMWHLNAVSKVFCCSKIKSQVDQSPHHAAATIWRELSPTSNVYRPVVIITQFCSSTSQ